MQASWASVAPPFSSVEYTLAEIVAREAGARQVAPDERGESGRTAGKTRGRGLGLAMSFWSTTIGRSPLRPGRPRRPRPSVMPRALRSQVGNPPLSSADAVQERSVLRIERASLGRVEPVEQPLACLAFDELRKAHVQPPAGEVQVLCEARRLVERDSGRDPGHASTVRVTPSTTTSARYINLLEGIPNLRCLTSRIRSAIVADQHPALTPG